MEVSFLSTAHELVIWFKMCVSCCRFIASGEDLNSKIIPNSADIYRFDIVYNLTQDMVYNSEYVVLW